jgi:elongation factor Ts
MQPRVTWQKHSLFWCERATATASKKGDRTLGAGVVQAYIHATGQVGALVTLSCETDFVAKNEEFVALAAT